MNSSDSELDIRSDTLADAVPIPAPVTSRGYASNPSAIPLGSAPVQGRSAFLPLLLVVLALVGWLGFQATQLSMESRQLALADTTLTPQEQAATKLRASLDSIAAATAKLSAEGNPNARAIVDELRRRGVTIKSPTADAPK